MLRNEVWQFSGVAPRVLLYTGRGYHLRLVKPNDGPEDGKVEKMWKFLQSIAGLVIRLPGVENLFSPFSNSNSCTPACGGAAQGQKMGKRSENHPICVKLAENPPICEQWQTAGDFLRTLTCARTDWGKLASIPTWASATFLFMFNISNLLKMYFKFWQQQNSWEDLIMWYRVFFFKFFNWYPPKKLKYGKPRLGVSTLM